MENNSKSFKDIKEFIGSAFIDFYVDVTTKISYFFHNFKPCMVNLYKKARKNDSCQVFS